MYQTFKASLFKPAHIFPRIKDKMSKAWLFFFLMLILTIIPVVVKLSVNPGILSDERNDIKALYREGLSGNYYIIDGRLDLSNIGNTQKGIQTENYIILLGDRYIADYQSAVPFIFALTETGIKYSSAVVVNHQYSYTSLGITNLDLSDGNSAAIIINALDRIVQDNLVSHHAILFGLNLFSNGFRLILIVLFLSLLTLKPLPFNLKFKLNMFLLAPVSLFIFLGAIYGLSSEFFIIGVVWMSINSIRLFRNIVTIKK